jgi:hypothetical protein
MGVTGCVGCGLPQIRQKRAVGRFFPPHTWQRTVNRGGGGCGVVMSELPQPWQKLALTRFIVPQTGQETLSRWLHPWQKEAPARLAVLHLGQTLRGTRQFPQKRASVRLGALQTEQRITVNLPSRARC